MRFGGQIAQPDVISLLFLIVTAVTMHVLINRRRDARKGDTLHG